MPTRSLNCFPCFSDDTVGRSFVPSSCHRFLPQDQLETSECLSILLCLFDFFICLNDASMFSLFQSKPFWQSTLASFATIWIQCVSLLPMIITWLNCFWIKGFIPAILGRCTHPHSVGYHQCLSWSKQFRSVRSCTKRIETHQSAKKKADGRESCQSMRARFWATIWGRMYLPFVALDNHPRCLTMLCLPGCLSQPKTMSMRYVFCLLVYLCRVVSCRAAYEWYEWYE